jgi:hypothetical protein
MAQSQKDVSSFLCQLFGGCGPRNNARAPLLGPLLEDDLRAGMARNRNNATKQ